jgi:hypothetical protein
MPDNSYYNVLNNKKKLPNGVELNLMNGVGDYESDFRE